MINDCYLFIDSGHLQYYRESLRDWFGEDPELDPLSLQSYFSASKCFFYDCLDDLPRHGETATDRETRINKQQAEFSRIRSVKGTHVRLGSLVGSHNKTRRQKEVDILLAVDMMNHASRRNMSRAVLVSGDRDFRPVVEALVQMGMFVEVAGDACHTSSVLAEAADFYHSLTIDDYYQWSSKHQQSIYSILGLAEGIPDLSGYTLIKYGTIGAKPIELHQNSSSFVFLVQQANQWFHSALPDYDRLLLYIKHRLGKINWAA